MMKYSEIRSMQIEVSNYCNAACPQCPRNYFGGATMPSIPMRKMSLTTFKKLFTIALLEQLEQVYFCGTYGDPLTNSNLVDMCKFLHESNPNIRMGVHTNGGVGSQTTFQELARYTNFIAFGIDGLEDTNHIYRRHVRWNKVIENAQAYINAGGHAIWDFIVFKHNEHQIDLARQFSLDLGFSEFGIKKTGRFLTRDHTFSNKLAVHNNNNFIEYTISLPENAKYINEGYKLLGKQQKHISDYAKNTCISCNAKKIKEIYIASEGFVFPCGWLHDRLYGPEVENHSDHLQIKSLMQQAGGWQKINIFHTPLKEIIDNGWFRVIESSWTSLNRLERCGITCGQEVNLIGSQNEEVDYKE